MSDFLATCAGVGTIPIKESVELGIAVFDFLGVRAFADFDGDALFFEFFAKLGFEPCVAVLSDQVFAELVAVFGVDRGHRGPFFLKQAPTRLLWVNRLRFWVGGVGALFGDVYVWETVYVIG